MESSVVGVLRLPAIVFTKYGLFGFYKLHM